MYNQTEFLERAQILAKSKKTSLKRVAAETGISNSAFTDWKKGRGKPSIETFCKIADYFDVSLDYLAYGEDEKPLDFSSYVNPELNDKYSQLPPDLQQNVITYIDGMLAVLNKPQEKRLSV